MCADGRLVLILAALIGLATLSCSKDEGQGGAEAGAPSDAEAGAPSAAETGPPSHAETGAPSSGSICGGGGAKATVELDAIPASTTPDDVDAAIPSPVAGTAVFATTASGVDLKIKITGCVNGSAYPVVIHEGAACTSATLQGPEWDPPRGEGIAGLTCTGNSGVGLLYYSRPNGDPKPWSVGAPSSSDVVGRVLVIHDPSTMEPLACGTIAPAPDDAGASTAAPPSDAGAIPSAAIRAQVAGLCEYRSFSPTPQCPDSEKLTDCACTHCDLSACLSQCSNYTACLAGQPDAGCAAACPVDPVCTECRSDIFECLLGFCPDVVSCNVPTPGGPCSEVEACCAMQHGPRAQQCLAAIQSIEKLGGDQTCIGLMHDGDFLSHAAFDPPCNFDDAGAADAADVADAPVDHD
jgi:hypothetical protein